MINTVKSGSINGDIGGEVIKTSLSEDKEFKTRGIQMIADVTFPISE